MKKRRGVPERRGVVIWGALFVFLLIAYGPVEGAGETEPSDTQDRNSRGSPVEHPSSDPTFEKLLDRLLPLTPEQIRQLRKRTIETSRATHGDSPPQIHTRSVQYHPEPGQKPIVIHMTPGFVATLAVVDGAGAPWSISSYTVGKPDGFRVLQPDLKQKNRLTVSTQNHGVTSNLALTLQDLNTPVILLLESSPLRTDGLTTLRITRRGPNAPEPVMESPSNRQVVPPVLLDFLDGVYPKQATAGTLRPSTAGEVWRFRKSLYLRTPLRLLSPPWDVVVKGGETTRVYRMPLVDVLLLSEDGDIRSVEVLFDE